jgi:hypothetical protein
MVVAKVPVNKPQSAVSMEDIKRAMTNEEVVPNGCAVRILLGKSNESIGLHLLNARWNQIDSICQANKEKKKKQLQVFFEDCISKAGKKGYEVIRNNVGGPIEFNETMMNFLQQDGIFPRTPKGCSFIRTENKKKLLVFYNNRDGVPVLFKQYKQPVIGGQFDADTEMNNNNPVLKDLTKYNFLTALVCNEFNNDKTLSGNFGKVQPGSVERTLNTLNSVCDGNNNIRGELLLTSLAMKHDSLSVIAWPCCYHYDSYSSNKNEKHGGGFESKTHFKFRRIGLQKQYGNGRGGSDSRNYFTFTITLCPKRNDVNNNNIADDLEDDDNDDEDPFINLEIPNEQPNNNHHNNPIRYI